MKLVHSRQIFEKTSTITFHKNPSSGSRVSPCGQTEMKLIVAFRNFANAPKNSEGTIVTDTQRVSNCSCVKYGSSF